MATRNRTNLYISYRQSYAHHPTQGYSNFNAASTEELDTLISHNRADAAIEMDILPPAWADTTQQVDEILGNITKMSAKLDKLHARHVLPGFDDKSEEEGEIERLTSEITKVQSSLLFDSDMRELIGGSYSMTVRDILKRFNGMRRDWMGRTPSWPRIYKSLWLQKCKTRQLSSGRNSLRIYDVWEGTNELLHHHFWTIRLHQTTMYRYRKLRYDNSNKRNDEQTMRLSNNGRERSRI
jgi:hypothetical protein